MSRFADQSATEVVVIGVCQCPGTPHERDEATVRRQLSGSALARIGRAELEGAVRLDPMAAYRQVILESVVSWNLLALGPAGKERPIVAVPITPATVAELDSDTLTTLATAIDALVAAEGQLPNASGAPSAESSPGSASHRRTRTPKHGT